MKKFLFTICFLCTTLCAFAYYGDYSYSYEKDEMSGFEIFTLIVMIVYIILSIVILCRWWNMTSNVEKICNKVTQPDPKLTYLIAIGEKEEAEKAALKMLVDMLLKKYSVAYYNDDNRITNINKVLEEKLPIFKRLELNLPDHVTSTEKFIDYMNKLTGNSFPNKVAPQSDTDSNS